MTTPGSSGPHVTQVLIKNYQDSLTLNHPGVVNIFALATGGNEYTSKFAHDEIETGIDGAGYVAAALADYDNGVASDHYTTDDLHYSIGAVGVSGFTGWAYGVHLYIPPIQPKSVTHYEISVSPASFVIIIGLSGGQDMLTLSGVPGLKVLANGTGPGWAGIVIAECMMKANVGYKITERSTNDDSGSPDRADIIGVFAFSNGAAAPVIEFSG